MAVDCCFLLLIIRSHIETVSRDIFKPDSRYFTTTGLKNNSETKGMIPLIIMLVLCHPSDMAGYDTWSQQFIVNCFSYKNNILQLLYITVVLSKVVTAGSLGMFKPDKNIRMNACCSYYCHLQVVNLKIVSYFLSLFFESFCTPLKE